MIEALGKGDEVVSAGGLLGKVTKINENYVTLEVASGVEINIQRSAISTLLPKGTIKGI
jgi:preprotein translocase subunit YajC